MAFALLGKLLDIEWMLRRDEERSSAELAQHDRALFGSKPPSSPEQALERWLHARRRELDDRTLGVRASELLTTLHALLIGLALAAGAGTAQALLHGPSAQSPTNVLSFIFATLLWPLALLAGSLVLLALRGRIGRSVLLEDLFLIGVGLLGRLAQRAPASDGWDVARQWRALRRGGRRYQDIEVATLLAAAQWYPIAFHLGAALALTGAALFSDLAFAWSTTNDSLEPHTLASMFRVVAAPWCGTLGIGCVSPELVEATRWRSFTERYALPQGATLSGAWWPALVGCLLVYGVLPRLVLSLGLSTLVQSRVARLEERVLELRARLHGVTVRVGRAEPAPAPAAAGATAGPAPALAARARSCWVIAWRGAALSDAALGALCMRLGLRAERRDTAGDGAFEQDESLLQGPGAMLPAVLLLADGWEAPDKATRRFVEALRHGTDRPVFVGLLIDAADAPELGIWRDRLGLLADPRVSVEAIVSSPRHGPEAARA